MTVVSRGLGWAAPASGRRRPSISAAGARGTTGCRLAFGMPSASTSTSGSSVARPAAAHRAGPAPGPATNRVARTRRTRSPRRRRGWPAAGWSRGPAGRGAGSRPARAGIRTAAGSRGRRRRHLGAQRQHGADHDADRAAAAAARSDQTEKTSPATARPSSTKPGSRAISRGQGRPLRGRGVRVAPEPRLGWRDEEAAQRRRERCLRSTVRAVRVLPGRPGSTGTPSRPRRGEERRRRRRRRRAAASGEPGCAVSQPTRPRRRPPTQAASTYANGRPMPKPRLICQAATSQPASAQPAVRRSGR